MSSVDSTVPVKVGIERLVRHKGDFTVRMIPAERLKCFEMFPYFALASLLIFGAGVIFLERLFSNTPVEPAAWAAFVLWSGFVFRYYFSSGRKRWASEVERETGHPPVVFLRGWTILFMVIPLAIMVASIFHR